MKYFISLLLSCVQCFAANHYINAGASGSHNGSDWSNAWTLMSQVSWTRGDTYYVGTGSYLTTTFSTATNGVLVITVKKATVADHGTSTGWSDSFAAQAVFAAYLSWTTPYWVFDGNGTFTVPSNNSSDYGFQVLDTFTNMSDNSLRFESGDITVRYTWVTNAYSSTDNSGGVAVGYWPLVKRTKLQNCFLQQSGRDGLQINSASQVLVERCYLYRLGNRPAVPGNDQHGQAVQLFGNPSNSDFIFRWNIWDSCEGQSLINYGQTGTTNNNLRFYGNVVFNSGTNNYGFNAGILDDSASGGYATNAFFYNNTYVNLRTTWLFPTWTESMAFQFRNAMASIKNTYHYNELYYNCENVQDVNFTATGWHASGGLGTAGGTSEQTGITNTTFTSYTGNNFTLRSATQDGKHLTGESWWNTTPDTFFVTLDSQADMNGNVRGLDGNWDRGAFEFTAGYPFATGGVTFR